MKRFMIVILIPLVFYAQKPKEIEMLENFTIDLFNHDIQAEKVVDEYLEITPNPNNKLSLKERTDAAKHLIDETRLGKGETGMWIMPDYRIGKLKKPVVVNLVDYESLNKFNFVTNLRDRIYLLLNKDRTEILQYFLLNKNRTRLLSFSLFIKDSCTASSFTF